MSERQSHRYHLLDAIRGVAAIGVLLFHSYSNWLNGEITWPASILVGLIENGWRGVQIFFVVSGYCVAERLFNEHGRKGTARRFLLDRLWRIAPPYWAALTLSLILGTVAMPFNGKPLLSDMVASSTFTHSIIRIVEMFALIEPWLNRSPFLIVSWTLSFEIMFYGIAALGLATANKTGRMSLSFGAGLILALLGMIPSVGFWCPVLSLWPQFFLGMIAWWLVNRPPAFTRRQVLAPVVFCAAVVISNLAKPSAGSALGLAAFTGWLIVVLSPFDAVISRLPPVRWAGSVGLWSYSLYLVHVPVVSKSRNLLGRWFEHSRLGSLVPFFCAVVAMVLGWYFYRYVESTSEKYRKRLLQQWWPITVLHPPVPTRILEDPISQIRTAIPAIPVHESRV